MSYLCVDIGTTCSKVQVFDKTGAILYYESKECDLKDIGGNKYADILLIRDTVFSLIKSATSKITDILSVAFSSFGESFVLLDSDDNILTYPMLYTDTRGSNEAKEILDIFTVDDIYHISGVLPHPMYSLYKLMYIRKKMPEEYKRAHKLLLICDYFGFLLTGKRVIDYALASRTGVFDIHERKFSHKILDKLGIDYSLFSEPMEVGSVVGNVKEDVAAMLGLNKGCKLVLGSHDQVCATIGAGAINTGDSADGMGTVECITTIFDSIPDNINAGLQGYPIVPFLNGKYCTYMWNMTNNSVLNWFRKEIMHGYTEVGKSQFEYFDERAHKPTDILVLPYFSASSTPYQDERAKGAFINMTLESTDADIYRAILECTSYEMKLNMEIVKDYGINVSSVVATGGGANSKLWLRIKSDIFGMPVKSLRSSEGGICGLAMLSSVALKDYESLSKAKEVFIEYKDEFLPQGENEYYLNKYKKYKKLYISLKEFF